MTSHLVLTNTYDAASNRTRLSSTIGGTADFQNDYSYDNLLRLIRLDQVGQSGGNTVASKRLTFSYDVGSRLTEVARQYKPSGTWTEVATTALSYDNINRLTGIDHKQGGTSLFTPYSYTFDNANRITGLTSQDGTVAYTYDATSQITGADYSFQTDEAFSWSANGNRTNTGYTTGTNNKMTSDGVYNYTYDNEGNLILRVKISDGSRREFTWDYRNRLTNITERATQYGAATMTVDYVYDTFDRRISKSFDADGAGGGSAVTSRYVFDGSDNPQPILQFDGSNNLTHRNLWALDQIFAEEDSSNAILWNLGDNLGTVRDLIDNSGTVQNHLTYDAFGKVTSETASSIDFLMGFAGMVRDEETSAHYAWHRYTQAGRWWSEDPITFRAGDPNLQRVVSNNPISIRDPLGLWGEDWFNNGSFMSWTQFGWTAWAADGITTSLLQSYYDIGGIDKDFELKAADRRSYFEGQSTFQRNDVQSHGQNSTLPPSTARVIQTGAEGNIQFMAAGAGGMFIPERVALSAGASAAAAKTGSLSLDDVARLAGPNSGKVAAEIGASSRLVPGAGLASHEAAGGHTIGMHVGKSIADLAKRLVDEPRIPAASTFTDRQIAEQAIAATLERHRTEIETWLANGSRRLTPPLRMDLGYKVGTSLREVPLNQQTQHRY